MSVTAASKNKHWHRPLSRDHRVNGLGVGRDILANHNAWKDFLHHDGRCRFNG